MEQKITANRILFDVVKSINNTGQKVPIDTIILMCAKIEGRWNKTYSFSTYERKFRELREKRIIICDIKRYKNYNLYYNFKINEEDNGTK